MLFEEGGAGDEGGAGCRDIIDEPESFIAEKIHRSITSYLESVVQICFSGLFAFLSRLREGEAGANERGYLWHEIQPWRDGVGESLCEELCLIETTPLLAPVVERNEENHVREGKGCPPERFGEEVSEREREALRETIFVGMDDVRDERALERTRGKNAIERCFPGACKATRATRSDDALTRRTV